MTQHEQNTRDKLRRFDAILAVLDAPLTDHQIAVRARIVAHSIKPTLAAMVKAGIVKRHGTSPILYRKAA